MVALEQNTDRAAEDQASQKWLLYLIAWQGEGLASKRIRPNILRALLAKNFVESKGDGFVATETGRSLLSANAQRALERPLNFEELPPEHQWTIDRTLGLLDWDGS